MLEYKRETVRGIFVKCWWCDEEFYTEFGRFKHLWTEHPRFFEEFDKINDWNPFSTAYIPYKPDDLEDESEFSERDEPYEELDAENDDLSDIPTQEEVEEWLEELRDDHTRGED